MAIIYVDCGAIVVHCYKNKPPFQYIATNINLHFSFSSHISGFAVLVCGTVVHFYTKIKRVRESR